MIRRFFFAAAMATLVGGAVFTLTRRATASAPVQQPRRAAFLIRFGLDLVKDIDWSGSVSPAPARIVNWQQDAGEDPSGSQWKGKTRERDHWATPYERRMGPTASWTGVDAKGLVVEYDLPAPAEIRVTTAQGSFSFAPSPELWRAPRSFLGGKADVRAAPALNPSNSSGDSDYPSMLQAKDGALWLAWQEFHGSGDRVFVRRRLSGAWSDPEALSETGGDIFRTALAQDAAGKIWLVWSAQQKGNFDLYARSYDGKEWSATERLTTATGSDIYHTLISDRSGRLFLAWQSSRLGNFDIFLRTYDGKRWSKETQVSSDPASDWEPALAAAPDGRVTVLWDTYAKGNYDLVARTWRDGKLEAPVTIAASGAMETRASAAYDAQGRLWIAFDEGDWNWGKDYGNDIPESGRGLLVRRQTRIAVMANGVVQETRAPVRDAVPADLQQVFHAPNLVFDASGNPWIFFHYRVNLPRIREAKASRGMWRVAATVYRDGRWLPMLEFPGGFGRIEAPIATAVTPDGIEAAWPGDGRTWSRPVPRHTQLFTAALPAMPGPAAADLVAFTPSAENLPPSHATENGALAKVRAYRAKGGGKSYRIVRGDVHRHTDLSWDGNRDGSLHDAYRYALDAVGFEYMGVCDHQAGGSVPYHWWMIQKAVDLFSIPGRFAPLYSYERSLPWPNGHRNVLFAKRGNPIFDPSEAEQKGVEGAARLYSYLRPLGGLAISHTSATGAGTDFRDSDKDLEPVVEIYQGYRNNYEEPRGPRHNSGAEATRYKDGFIWNAWAKGLRLGVQSSSDHVSTHISYAALYVERIDRDSIFEALRARRTFAATDNLAVDFGIAGHLMGEEVRLRPGQAFSARITGTAPVQRVSVVRDNRIVHTVEGSGPELAFQYTDREKPAGTSYYYLRVEQKDGQLAWSSPIWVTWE
ncbi:MAG: hypothetical protein EXQ52_08245 [Bryobacterales bacterium]|nr:hypothetical protein [Bryobacterales bacterium]